MVAILGMRRGGYITLSTILLSLIFLYSYGQTSHGASTYDSLHQQLSSTGWYPSSRSTPCFSALEHGRKVLLDTYSERLKGVTHVALLDWPWHHNSGDSAIWLGEVALLEAMGIEVVYICGIDDCVKEEYDAALKHIPRKQTAIMLHGGGNFGDLWVSHQFSRNKIIDENHDRKIVHFPQTFEFDPKRPSELFVKVKEVYGKHDDLTLVARDSESYAFMAESFPTVTVRLVPDMAFFIGYNPNSPLTPPIMRPPGSDMTVLGLKGPFLADFTPTAASPYTNASPKERSPLGWPGFSFVAPATHDVVVLARSDREGGQDRQDANHWVPPLAPYDVVIKDWGDQWHGIKSPEKKHSGTIDNGAGVQVPFTHYWNQAAVLRVQWALQTLSDGKVVISDRLHTEILTTLLGLAHVVVETGHLRKITKVMDTWLGGCVIPLEEMERTVGEQSGWKRKTDANTIFTHDNAEAVEAARLFLKAEEKGARWSRVSE